MSEGSGPPTAASGEEPSKPGHAEVRELMASDAITRMVVNLAGLFPRAAADAEDAVTDAVTKFLAKCASGEDIENPATWIYVAAKRFLINKIDRQVNREESGEYLPEPGTDGADIEVLDRDTFKFLKGLIDHWESRRLAVITLLYLEAEYEGDSLSQQEAADEASVLLDEDVPWTSIGKTRARGFTRLREEILQIAEQTGINPINGK